MKTDHAQKLTPDEMNAALAAYTGPIKKIPTGKRVTRAPSKKPGDSGSWRHVHWGEEGAASDSHVWGS
jgi:hypothetical protein